MTRCWASCDGPVMVVVGSRRVFGGQLRQTGSDARTTRRRANPRCPWLVPVPRRRRESHLRWQGEVASPEVVQLLPEPGQLATAHGPDGRLGRERRMDPGPQRRRGAHARVQPHQAAQAPLQRAPARRQELPVPRADDGGRVATGDGPAGPAERSLPEPLLRALRPRLRHQGNPRPAAAHVPRA